jgi:hypothetical protein
LKISRRGLLVAIPGAALDVTASGRQPENAFADAYNEWIRLRARTPEGAVNAQAIVQWKRVRKAWRELEHSVG